MNPSSWILHNYPLLDRPSSPAFPLDWAFLFDKPKHCSLFRNSTVCGSTLRLLQVTLSNIYLWKSLLWLTFNKWCCHLLGCKQNKNWMNASWISMTWWSLFNADKPEKMYADGRDSKMGHSVGPRIWFCISSRLLIKGIWLFVNFPLFFGWILSAGVRRKPSRLYQYFPNTECSIYSM